MLVCQDNKEREHRHNNDIVSLALKFAATRFALGVEPPVGGYPHECTKRSNDPTKLRIASFEGSVRLCGELNRGFGFGGPSLSRDLSATDNSVVGSRCSYFDLYRNHDLSSASTALEPERMSPSL